MLQYVEMTIFAISRRFPIWLNVAKNRQNFQNVLNLHKAQLNYLSFAKNRISKE